jgi:hypothetical protein
VRRDSTRPAERPEPAPGQEPPAASGGGFSSLSPRPAYQAGVPGIATGRGVPDVAADASPTTGMAVAFDTGRGQVVGPADGTSAGAPFWAAVVALADQPGVSGEVARSLTGVVAGAGTGRPRKQSYVTTRTRPCPPR